MISARPRRARLALAGHFGWIERGSLSGGQMALTILPLNLVFAAGIALGAGIAQKVALPTPQVALVAAGAMVLAPPLCLVLGDWISLSNEAFWTGVNKPLESPLRVAHVLALAYLFVAFHTAPVVRSIHRVAPDNPFCRLGRRSLQVFTCGAILATMGRELLFGLFSNGLMVRGSASALAVELAIVAAGFAAMLWVADQTPAKTPRPLAA